MTLPSGVARRRCLALLGGTAVALVSLAPAAFGQVDQGIGGTGRSPPPIDKDQGIGGTGVIGTIRRFGSIVVNGLRIGYPRDVQVTLDGEPATVAALKLGHVVRLVARRERGALTTRNIAVTSEVVGKVEKVSPQGLTVAGQTISVAGSSPAPGWKIGDHVGVSGLRRLDGVIVASLVERRPETINRVAGPVVKAANGTLMIGALPLSGLDPSFLGQRAVIEGKPTGHRFEVTRARTEQDLLGGGATRLSLEAYVERRGDALRLGSGLTVTGGALQLRDGRAGRGVLVTAVGRGGRLQVQALRFGAADVPGRRPDGRVAPERANKPGTGPKPARADLRDLGSDRIGQQRPPGLSGEQKGFGNAGRRDRGGHGSGGNPANGGGHGHRR